MAQSTRQLKEWVIISGDPSSDVYGEKVIEALPPGTKISGVGGPRMRKLVPELIDQEPMAVMGLGEVLKRLPSILGILRRVKKSLRSEPKNVLLMDSPGFNMRLLKLLKQHNHHVIYWIPPQVWAWHESRLQQLKDYVDELWVLYDFEVKYYLKHNVKVTQARHPLLDKPHLKPITPPDNSKLHLLCLPGSRKQEIEPQRELFLEACDIISKDIPITVQMVCHNPDHPCWRDWKVSKDYPVSVCHGLANINPAHMALATSGTITLECGLMGIPTIVSFPWRSLIPKLLITKDKLLVDYVSLPNLIFNTEVFPEKLGENNTADTIAQAMRDWWGHQDKMDQIRQKLGSLPEKIGSHMAPLQSLIDRVV